ncbi:hypothetical protein LP7551_01866 [Roseibium album]|nr:hypothetical protein LP7551_01866 [Roseibium album]
MRTESVFPEYGLKILLDASGVSPNWDLIFENYSAFT